jgi:perosamine synthetase
MYSITVDSSKFGLTRDVLARVLDEAGIDTRPFFYPLHRLPPYRDANAQLKLPVTERLARSGLNLPSGGRMTNAEVDRIAVALRGAGRRP